MQLLNKHKPLFLVIALYLLVTLLIWPFDNYIISDEWSSLRQLEAFTSGVYRINAAKDTSFILQGVLGAAVTFLTDSVFLSVRILSFINALLFTLGVYLALSVASKKAPIKKALTVATFLFNPLVFFLSFTFLSEIYFLTFLSWTIYFYFKYTNSNKLFFLLIAGAMAAGSILIRQQGVFVVLALIIGLIVRPNTLPVTEKPVIAQKTRNVLLVMFLGLAGLFIYGLWPRYLDWEKKYLFSGFVKLIGKKNVGAQITSQIYLYLYSYFYFALFLGPILKINKIKNIIRWVAVVFFAGIIYHSNIFYLGNILYLEGIYAKSEHNVLLSIFNNTFFKLMVALLIGYLSVQLFLNLKRIYSKYKNITAQTIFLTALFILLFVSNFFVIDVYDRYLLPSFVVLGIIIVTNRSALKTEQKNKQQTETKLKIPRIIIKRDNWNYVLLGGFVIFSVLTTFEYINYKKLSYSMAQDLQKIAKPSKIYVDDAYGKYFKSKESNDFTGLIYPHPEDCCSCFIVKKYEGELPSMYGKFLMTLNPTIRAYTHHDRKLKMLQSKNVEVVAENSFSEPTRNLLGIQSTIKAYCKK